MTVSVTTTESATFSGNGSTTAFNTGFAFDADSWVKVYVYTTSTGARVLKELTTHYTLTGAGTGSAGTCTFLSAPATGTQVKMFKVPPLTQTQDYTNGSSFPNEATEAALDKLTHIQQYHQSQLDRVLKVIGTDSVSALELPTLTGAAGKAIVVNSGETGYEYVTLDSAIPTQTGNSGKLLTTDGSALSWETQKTLSTIAGTLPVASGGTGSTSASDARTALGVTADNVLPSQGSNSGKYLTTNGTTASWATVSSGSGNATLLDTVSIGSSAVQTIALTGSYTKYRIEFEGISPINATRFLALRLGTGVSTYNTTAAAYGSNIGQFNGSAASATEAITYSVLALNSLTKTTTDILHGVIEIIKPHSTFKTLVRTEQFTHSDAVSSAIETEMGWGFIDETSDHTHCQLGFASSSFTAGGESLEAVANAGTYRVYGIL